MKNCLSFLRYPGGKRRLISFLSEHLPSLEKISGRYIEPFVGGGSIFFYLQPSRAVLSDINNELIDLYRGIRYYPEKVWQIYQEMPSSKRGYNQIRKLSHLKLDLVHRAARSLFLNRTCFKGMWRHNADGEFNIGYGGQSRRWSIAEEDLIAVSRILRRAIIKCSDFEDIIKEAKHGDYLFLDPPYRPGEKEQLHAHYIGRKFTFKDHKRLASCLKIADKRGINWSLTTSSHYDIVKLFTKFRIKHIPRGTGSKIGILTNKSGEIFVSNHNGGLK